MTCDFLTSPVEEALLLRGSAQRQRSRLTRLLVCCFVSMSMSELHGCSLHACACVLTLFGHES